MTVIQQSQVGAEQAEVNPHPAMVLAYATREEPLSELNDLYKPETSTLAMTHSCLPEQVYVNPQIRPEIETDDLSAVGWEQLFTGRDGVTLKLQASLIQGAGGNISQVLALFWAQSTCDVCLNNLRKQLMCLCESP